MKTGYKICDAMTQKPVTVSVITTLKDCAQIMKEKHVGSLIVVEKDKPKGIITEQDIVRKAVIHGGDVGNKQAKQVMETNLVTITPEKDVFEALKIMRDYNIRHIPVVDGKKMIGFITSKDILKLSPELFDLLIEKFETKEEKTKPAFRMSDKEGLCKLCGEYSPDLKNIDGSMTCKKCRES